MVMRIGGIATGIDTDTVVKQMLAREQAKIDKVSGNKQVLQWQQETYRDFATAIKGFKDKYFDLLNKQSYALSNDFFSSMAAKIVGVDSGILGIKANNTAKAGAYKVTVEQQAKGAVLQSGKDIKLKGTDTLSGTITIKTGDMENGITLKDEDLDANGNPISIKNVSDLVKVINSDSRLKGKVTANFSEISGKFTLETVGIGSSKSLEVSGDMNATLKLSTTGSTAKGSNKVETKQQFITSNQIKDTVNDKVAEGSTKLSDIGIKVGDKISIGVTNNGKVTNIDIDLDKIGDINGLMAEIEKTIPGSSVTINEGKISIIGTSYTEKDGVTFEVTGNKGVLNKLGFATDATGNDADPVSEGSKKIVTSTDYVIELTEAKNGASTKININGKEVELKFDGSDEIKLTGEHEGISLKKRTDGSGNVSYYLTSKTEFNVSGTNLGSIIKPDLNVSAGGQDAKITVELPDGSKGTITSPKNSFTKDGITFDIKGEKPGEVITFNVEANVDKAVENIKGFVDAYNELIDSIGSKIYEKKQYKYAPLTDEQKKGMKEDEIKTWEAKCKEGIIKNDPALSKFLGDLRSAFYVESDGTANGSKFSLKDVGIGTTNDYSSRGKLDYNEEKLRAALAENPDDVAQLFMRESREAYNKNETYSANSTRTKENGIFTRISDIIEDTIRTTRNKYKQKGSLLEKAGIVGDTTYTENAISKQIKEKDTMLYDLARKMQDRETALYRQFAYLEKMTNNYNAQGSWLTQQLGGM